MSTDATYRRAVKSSPLHAALVSAFGIPVDDRFHVIGAHIPDSTLVGPASFVGVQHADRVAYFQIACGPGRTVEQKKNLYAQIARNLALTGHVSQHDETINLVEAVRENGSVGDGLALGHPQLAATPLVASWAHAA